LEEHILNCIELAVVSCEIVNQLNKEREAQKEKEGGGIQLVD